MTFQERDFRDKLVIFRGTNISNRNFFEDERFSKKLKNNATEQKNYIDAKGQKSSKTFISQLLLARYDLATRFSSKLLEEIFVK